MSDTEHVKKKKLPKVNYQLLAFAVLALVALAGIGYLYNENQKLRNDPKVLEQAKAKKNQEMLARLGKIYSVPTDETPAIWTVDNKENLKNNPFFKDAEVGDYLIVFAKAKKAVIYRDAANKVINSGPIAIASDGTPQSAEQPATPATNNR